MVEWLKAPHSKCGVGASLPWVRIPPCPPYSSVPCQSDGSTDALRQSIVMQPRSYSDVDHCRFPPASRCSDKPVQSFNGAGSRSRSQHADSTPQSIRRAAAYGAERHGQRDLESAGHRPPWFRQCKKPDVPHRVACGNWRCCVRVQLAGFVQVSFVKGGTFLTLLVQTRDGKGAQAAARSLSAKLQVGYERAARSSRPQAYFYFVLSPETWLGSSKKLDRMLLTTR